MKTQQIGALYSVHAAFYGAPKNNPNLLSLARFLFLNGRVFLVTRRASCGRNGEQRNASFKPPITLRRRRGGGRLLLVQATECRCVDGRNEVDFITKLRGGAQMGCCSGMLWNAIHTLKLPKLSSFICNWWHPARLSLELYAEFINSKISYSKLISN